MKRKFVSLVPLIEEGRGGVWLYAVADDGTAWRARQHPDGTLVDEEWRQIGALPDNENVGYMPLGRLRQP